MRVLLIGFGPFPGAAKNPSADLAKALARRRRPALAGIARVTHVFATTYAAVDRDLPDLFAQRPEIVLIFGIAARRHHLCIETRARNAVSVLFPDASGYRPRRGVIAPGEPSARKPITPLAGLLGAMRPSGVPARLSRDAGRYLCNYAYWRALQHADHGKPLVQFVHIPALAKRSPSRREKRRHSPTLAKLTVAAEALLVALIAASRR